MKNCFTYYPYSKRYYLFHPWSFIAQSCRNIKAAWQRAAKGWCDRDTWNLDDYLLEVLSEMINHLSEHSHGYPERFGSFEKWQEYLKNEIVMPLQNAQEDQQVQCNEYKSAFLSQFYNKDGFYTYTFDRSEIDGKYLEREQEIFKWREEQLKKGLMALSEIFFDLWD